MQASKAVELLDQMAAASTIQHAALFLMFGGEQWEYGEARAATNDAIAILNAAKQRVYQAIHHPELLS